MFKMLRKRLSDEKGFTLIELLVVIIILGILMAIAVPAYMSFRGRANDSAAQANVTAAVPAMEAFATDNGTYTGATLVALQAIDAGVKLDGDPVIAAGGASYCIQSTVNATTFHIDGPGGDAASGAC